MKHIVRLAGGILAAACVLFGQQPVLRQYTVATMPAASANSGISIVVKDGSTATDCSVGSGSFAVVCKSNGTTWSAQSIGSGASVPGAGLVKSNGTSLIDAAASDVVALFGSGSCSGYLKSDGTCNTPGGNVSTTSLTTGAIVTASGTTAIQTPNASTTLDTSGNVTTPGAIKAASYTTNASTPGDISLLAGTGSVAALSANSAGFAAPATGGTSYLFKLPGTALAGLLFAAAPATGDGVNESALSFKSLQGTDTNILTAGTVSGTGSSLCTSANGGATTSGCPSYLTGNQTITLSGDVTGSGTTAITTTAAKVNGTSVPTNSAADQVLGTTASATGAWISLVNCVDSAGNHLNYATATHTFSCGNSGTGGGFSNPMTTLGDLIYGAASGTATRFAGNTTSTKEFLTSTGSAGAATAPAWGTVTSSDVSGLAASATTDTTNASNITSGTLNAARLPTTVVQTNQVNTYTNQAAPATPSAGSTSVYMDSTNKVLAAKNDAGTVSNTVVPSTAGSNQFATGIGSNGAISYAQPAFSNISGTVGAAQLPNPSATTLGGIESIAATSHQFLTSISTSGVPAAAQPAASDISGLAASATTDTTNATNISSGTLSNARLSGSGATTVNGQACTLGSTCTVSGATNTQTSSYTLTAADLGKLVVMNCSAACTVTMYGSPTNGYYGEIESVGTTVATVSLNSKNFNGATTVPVLNSTSPLAFWSDGTNYFGGGAFIAGSGVTLTPSSAGLTISASSSGGNMSLTTGAGAPSGSCTAGTSWYLDTTNQDDWFCSATNTWKKNISTSNSGPFVATGQTSVSNPTAPATGSASLFFNTSSIAQTENSSGSIAGTQVAPATGATSNQWVSYIDNTGTVHTSQPAFTNISGSVSAGQLPNPSASTLGGVESLASASHKWINTISTSGVPSATQPASTDLSDSANLATNAQSFTAGAFTYDFSAAAHTLPALKGTAASKPATCTQGEEYFATDATAGQNMYYCTAANTWTQQLNSGGSMVYPGAGIAVSTGSAWGSSLTAPTGSLVGTGQANTYSTGLQDLSAATLKMPIAAGAAPTTTGLLQYDSTTNDVFFGNGSQTNKITWFTGTAPTSGDCAKWGVNGQLQDQGSACGGAGGATSLNSITAATAANTITDGDNAQVWDWSLTTANKSAFTFGEGTASTATGSPYLLNVQTLSSSTANPLVVTAGGTANGIKVDTTGNLQAIGTGKVTATNTPSGGIGFAGSTSGTTTVAASATASGTLTLPATTDTLVGRATTDTLTNKSIAASEINSGSFASAIGVGTGGSLTPSGTGTITGTNFNDFPDKKYIPAANCNNATAGTGWSLPTSSAPTAACHTGTNVQDGYLQFADGQSAQFSLLLPDDWDSASSLDIRVFLTNSSTSGTVIMQAATSCTSTTGAETDDQAFNTAQSFGTITLSTPTSAGWIATLTGLTKTGCSAGNLLHVKISRTTDTATGAANISGAQLTERRTF